jgi:hypothetical protein
MKETLGGEMYIVEIDGVETRWSILVNAIWDAENRGAESGYTLTYDPEGK